MISLRDVTVRYGDTVAVDAISLDLGPSGRRGNYRFVVR